MADEKNKFENLIDSEHLALFLDKVKSIIADTAADYVKTESGKGLSTNDFTTALLEKLNGITAGAEPNVNADWNATTGDAQILNKPAIPDVSAKLDKTGNASSTTGVKGTFYFVANGDSDNDDVYIEYVWVNGKFEELGPRKIDLSGYLKTSDVSIASNDTINAMFTETTA